ncbi:MAG: hypothetical protein AB203_00380 [Parcubacteria bacterium C7867-008]|nr:MAG: hypothetical protein AB203_00380 [Parcubacteria bacterium C7867-008]
MRTVPILPVVLVALTLSACGTNAKRLSPPGPLNGLGNEPMAMLIVHKNPDYGDWLLGEYQVVVTHANSCFADVKRQQSGTVESVLTGAGVYGIPATLAAPTAISGFKGSTTGLPLEIGALNTVNGGVYGLIAKSGAVVSSTASCTSEDLKDSLTMRKAPGVHVVASPVRTRNGQETPAWAMPAGAVPPSAQSQRK